MALGHVKNRENRAKIPKPSEGESRTQNRRDIASTLSGKRVWQGTTRCHTLNDACLADERENCSHRRVTVEHLTCAIKAMTVGSGGPRSTTEIAPNGRPDLTEE